MKIVPLESRIQLTWERDGSGLIATNYGNSSPLLWTFRPFLFSRYTTSVFKDLGTDTDALLEMYLDTNQRQIF